MTIVPDDELSLRWTVARQTLMQFNSGVDLGNDLKAWGERFP